MYFDFLSLWELTLRSDLSDEDLKKLIPEKRGKLEDSIENFSLNSPGKSLVMLMGVPGSGKTTLAENFKKQFPNYNLNEKITPYIALVNPGDNQDVSSLVLNPANLILFDKLKNELDTDESLVQTLRLVSTKKEANADIKYTLVKDGGETAKFINVPKDIEVTHPYTTQEVIKKICETIEITLGPNHGFTSNKFHDICKRKNIKNNQDYCYQFPYSKNNIKKYSDLAIEYISQVYIEEIKNKK